MVTDRENDAMRMASAIVNATDSSTLALRGAARMYDDAGDTGRLLQLMYEQSAEQDDASRLRHDQFGTEGVRP